VEATLNLTPGRLDFRAALAALLLCLSLSACAMHWPWKRHPKPAPPPVHYVTVVSDAGAISQYWDRNTLQFDLTALGGEGHATLTPIKAVGWPIRLEFLVRPGSFAHLEAVGAQRVVFEIPAGGKNLSLKLAPGVYDENTESISLRWSAADDFAH
jgi:hypothetical protein